MTLDYKKTCPIEANNFHNDNRQNINWYLKRPLALKNVRVTLHTLWDVKEASAVCDWDRRLPRCIRGCASGACDVFISLGQ